MHKAAIITRKLEFDAGHRVWGHESKCAHLHGHRYVAEVSVTAPRLDSIGRIIDFSVIKSLVGTWIDNNWDHNILLNSADPLLTEVWQAKDESLSRAVFGDKAPFVMPWAQNPTAETMAAELFRISCALLNPKGMTVRNVRIYETPNCWADHSMETI